MVNDEDRDALAGLDDAMGWLLAREQEVVLQALAAHRIAAERRALEAAATLVENYGDKPDGRPGQALGVRLKLADQIRGLATSDCAEYTGSQPTDSYKEIAP
jgi:hypothetical protein